MSATSHLVGGISSAGRAIPPLDGMALAIAKAEGPYLWDVQGRRYVDTTLGFGGSVLGHAPPAVMATVAEALGRGPLPSFAHPAEEAAAAALAAHTGPLSRVVFTSTGSEAVHLACKIARAVTGRGTIAKMAAGYDGWYEEIAFGNIHSHEADMLQNVRPVRHGTTLLRFNDAADTEALFDANPDIAAVVVEPVLANAGCVMPQAGYMEHLQATAARRGALVIADEVMMGFRLHAGLTSHAQGLDPDLATVGKAIGSGIAVGGVVGRPEVMQACEDGRVVRAGTYSGNPVACAAVLATMAELDRADFSQLLARGEAVRIIAEHAMQRHGLSFSTSGFGSVFNFWFEGRPPESYAAAKAALRPDLSLRLHECMRRNGVLMMASGFGRHFLSFAHDDAAMAEMQAALETSALAMATQH